MSSLDCLVSDNLIAGDPPRILGFASVREEGNRAVRAADARPGTPEVRLYRDPYDAKRAHLAVFNWSHAARVTIPADGFARKGQDVLVYDPRNLRTPLRTVRCGRAGLELPMNGEFGAFVLRTR